MHGGKTGTVFTVQPGLSTMGRGTRVHTIVTADTLTLVNQQHIRTFDNAMLTELRQHGCRVGRFPHQSRFQRTLCNLLLDTGSQPRIGIGKPQKVVARDVHHFHHVHRRCRCGANIGVRTENRHFPDVRPNG